MISTIIGKNAKRIRHGQNLTQADVAKKAGIAIPTYSNIESGRGSPRMDTLYKVAAAMGVGIQELLVPVRELRIVRFRAQKKLKRRDQVLAKAARWLDDFNFLLTAEESKVEYALAKIPSKLHKIPGEQRSKEAARLAREEMGLDQDEPIHDITGLFAANGIKILAYQLDSDGFFGMSIGESDGGPAIVVNVHNQIPVERWIFSAAHELGHLLLHLQAFDVEATEEDESQEKEANAFAGYFLMPASGFKKEWDETCGLPFWQRVLKVKRIFRVSDKTVLYRLWEYGLVGDNIWQLRHRFLSQTYGAKRSMKFEPERLRASDFVTDWLDRLVRKAVEKETITWSRASEILDVPLQEFRKRASSWAEEKVAAKPGSALHY